MSSHSVLHLCEVSRDAHSNFGGYKIIPSPCFVAFFYITFTFLFDYNTFKTVLYSKPSYTENHIIMKRIIKEALRCMCVGVGGGGGSGGGG